MEVAIPQIQKPDTKDEKLVLDVPNLCPHCGMWVAPDVLSGVFDHAHKQVGFVIKCSNSECGKLYYASYTAAVQEPMFVDGVEAYNLNLVETYPTLLNDSLPKELNKLYPEFVKLFTQAERAERARITEAVGMLYRKALESIVKNYLKNKYPTDAKIISSESLSQSIQRIDYPALQNLARASSWIGNDSVHLTPKNPDYTVKDMRAYIISLSHLIVAEHSALSAMKLTKRKAIHR